MIRDRAIISDTSMTRGLLVIGHHGVVPVASVVYIICIFVSVNIFTLPTTTTFYQLVLLLPAAFYQLIKTHLAVVLFVR